MTTSARRPRLVARADEPAPGEGRHVLWRATGERKGRLEVSLTAEGALLLHHPETGPARRDAWGAGAYEATLEIRREDLDQLALLLLNAGFGNQRDALEQLRLFCERRGVRHSFAVWT
jgi:hypothetical protein